MGSKDTERSVQSAASRYVYVLRIAVTTGLFAAACTFGFLSYYALSSFEGSSAVERFHNIAHYARDTMANDFAEKKNVILGLSKNMAYMKPNASEWPNVVMPGFYDSTPSLRNSSNLDDIFFVPIVQPDQLPSFNDFAFKYFASEPAIGPGAGIPGLRVYGLGPNGPYNESTGETLNFNSSNRIITPLIQELFGVFNGKFTLAVNMHSQAQIGPAIDAMIECSKYHNYTLAGSHCVSVTKLTFFPMFAPPELVTDFHTAFLEPIYLNQNTSQLVGFMGGGFNWNRLLTQIFSDSTDGVQVIVRNSDTILTFEKHHGHVKFVGFGDHHDSNHDSLEHTITLLAAPDRENDDSAYTVSFYPSAAFYQHYTTNNPIYAAVASFVALSICAVIFFTYDAFVRGESEANAAVLETKRRFVRFISHEIRTPLNAVHLGLEALSAELAKVLSQLLLGQEDTSQCKDPAHCIAMLRSWLELSAEMMGNSESAVDVLNDLLNYDKIEMGTLYLDFSSVAIWDVVQSNVAVFHNQIKQKCIHWSVENRLLGSIEGEDDVDVEQQDCSQFIVVGDSARLAQVMRNLISNALKFTPNEGSIKVHVERVEGGLLDKAPAVPEEHMHLLDPPRTGSVRISVTDSGAGLSEAQLAKICSEGVQFNANELQAGKGSGLGLFITKGIVEQHGGKLTVSSAGLGAGTTFSVELPLFVLPKPKVEVGEPPQQMMSMSIAPLETSLSIDASSKLPPAINTLDTSPSTSQLEFRVPVRPPSPRAEAAAARAARTARQPPPLPPPSEQPRRVLVVDDASSNRKMLMRILTAKGYVCEQAEDGQQAIEVYRASVESGLSFYAITMDFEMPVMNGPTATGHLRALGCTVPIIGVTGNMLPDDIKHFKVQGAIEVIGKPVNLDKFENLMREHDSRVNSPL